MLAAASTANADLKTDLIGEYTGAVSGYEYVNSNGGTYSSSYGGENPTLKIEASDKEGYDIVIKDLIPAEFQERCHLDGLYATVTDETSYEGYLGYITIEPQKVGIYDYYYGDTKYELGMWYTGGWDTAWATSPSISVELWVTDSYTMDISTNGWAMLMDWNGDQSAWYYALTGGNAGNTWEKNTTSVNTVLTDSEAAAEYFNLNGVKVSNTELNPGIYVKRQGSTVKKVVVK